MQGERLNKVARLIQKELSSIFQEQTRTMHGVMVSVTAVRVSPDLSISKAYLSIFPSEKGEEIINKFVSVLGIQREKVESVIPAIPIFNFKIKKQELSHLMCSSS